MLKPVINTSVHNVMYINGTAYRAAHQLSLGHNLYIPSTILKAIPNTGSIHGGTLIFLLGKGFNKQIENIEITLTNHLWCRGVVVYNTTCLSCTTYKIMSGSTDAMGEKENITLHINNVASINQSIAFHGINNMRIESISYMRPP